MRDLAARLTALDPDAGAALQVIAYFDRLTEGRAGLQAIVRGAAVLAGCPARLADEQRRIHLRVHPDGTDTGAESADPAWMSVAVADGAVLWLERPGPPGPVDAMILERAAGAARTVLDRTRAHPPPADPALLELVLDADAPEPARLQAAARLGIKPHARVRAAARADGSAHLMTETDPPPDPHPRAGVGPAGPVADLPASYAAARTALRLTAEGTERDPGPRVVHADELGGLALLAATVGPDTAPIPDVQALTRVAAAAPWALATLDAVAESPSLRTAATALRVHHSTLQERLSHIDHVLGWDFRTPQGRLRLQLALALRRLTRN
ncbi:helix-turn-helix domain-containing protein [Actinoplanes sp. HUAS TT8]|uniref:helix-turn-helix domain-containing protein n=1 Tax=Actinoplanes sp. HUAS TT8 TaxID=3447453 RepID=UPI003F521600